MAAGGKSLQDGETKGWRAHVPSRALIAALPLGPRLSAAAVAQELAEGMCEGGSSRPESCLLREDGTALLEQVDFDAQMLAARAVVIAAARLDEQTLLGSLPFEIATRARQAGVPCYAVARSNALQPFDARILDLQVVIEAPRRAALREAGRRLAEIV